MAFARKYRFYGIVSCFAVSMLCFVACEPAPEIVKKGYADQKQVSVEHLKSLYTGRPVVIRDAIAISGVVTSSDRNSNFYQTLFVEDLSGAIAVKLGTSGLHSLFPRGYSVTIHCTSLTLGSYGGMIQLGQASPDELYEVESIVGGDIFRYVFPESGIPEKQIIPADIIIPQLSPQYVGRTVRLCDVEFVDAEMGLAWSDPYADTDRHITDRQGNTLIVRTSRHATFASQTLPRNSGYIEGILTWFNGNYQLSIINLYSVIMTAPRF